MLKDFILPDIGEGVVECELVDWLVKEGDIVTEDQPIADVMTDKALVQIPTPYDGKISKFYYQKGELAKVHSPLFSIELSEQTDANITTVQGDLADTEANTANDLNNLSKNVEDFLLPDIGEGIVECELVEWLVKEGDLVEEDQPIADVMTDKALVQIPALKRGKIRKLYYQQGELAQVHHPLYGIEYNDSENAALPKAHLAEVIEISEQKNSSQRHHKKALASPAVRRMARSYEIDLSLVAGSGKNGRVYKTDIEQYLNLHNEPKEFVTKTTKESAIFANQVDQPKSRIEPIRGVKAVMAKAMMESVQTIPHFTYCDELDLTELIALREEMKAKFATDKRKITLLPFFMKAMSMAITEFPILNSRVNADCTELEYLEDHNVGMAVDGQLGLLVPIVKSVQNKSILEVSEEITRLTDAARDGRIKPEDLKGGTISLSNIGALGGTVATPIINKPEVAIVALGKLQKLPRFNKQGHVEARNLMQISWSGDHRVIDGATMARFSNQWKHYLETPQNMLAALR